MANQPQKTPGTELDGKITPARIGRMIVFFLSAGFLYPNVMTEGMDLTAIQRTSQGTLYDKK
jgi:hypothetical protein